jgi:hypothetical protein
MAHVGKYYKLLSRRDISPSECLSVKGLPDEWTVSLDIGKFTGGPPTWTCTDEPCVRSTPDDSSQPIWSTAPITSNGRTILITIYLPMGDGDVAEVEPYIILDKNPGFVGYGFGLWNLVSDRSQVNLRTSLGGAWYAWDDTFWGQTLQRCNFEGSAKPW